MNTSPRPDPDSLVRQAMDSFAETYNATLRFVGDLIATRKHPQEVLLLLCARLDSLASSSVSEGEPSKKAFTAFLGRYSADEADFLTSVSAGDVYYEIEYHLWMLEGTITSPGRITRFSRVNDPIIQLIDISGIPITHKDAERLLLHVAKALRKHYRVAPRQKLAKPLVDSPARMRSHLLAELAKHYGNGAMADLGDALEPLLTAKAVATIFYEKFRSSAVHAGHVAIDEERFFSEAKPYFRCLSSDYCGPYQTIEFPARYLSSLIRICLNTYTQHILVTKKIPPDIAFHCFGSDVLDGAVVVDEALLPRSRTLRLKMPGR